MKKNISLKSVLVFASIMTAAIILLAISAAGMYFIRRTADSLYKDFQEAMDFGYELEIKSQIQTVISTVQREYDRFMSGEISEDEAKFNAKETVREMRYRDDSTGYFWIDDENYILVMHPILTENEGVNRYNLTDPDGVKIIQVIYETCHLTQGGGFNYFKFTKADGVTVAPKLAYSGFFEPWGWMISTGNYYDDIEKELAEKRAQIQSNDRTVMLSFSSITAAALLVVAVAFFVISSFVVVAPLKIVSESVHRIASGSADLSKRIKPPATRELYAIADGFNRFSEKMQQIVIEIKKSRTELDSAGKELEETARETTASVTQILSSINNSSGLIDKESGSVHEAVAAIQGISDDIENLEQMIETQSSGINQASAAVDQMIGNIGSVDSSMGKMAAKFEELSENISQGIVQQKNVNTKVEQIKTESEMLNDANLVIASIAEQTNLLAMNAAIEAAHAGEAGKGFSVVADEIRKLSETSSEQSKTIGNKLKNITESIGIAVELSGNSIASFSSVTDELSVTESLVNQIKSAMQEQTIGSSQINDALRSMNDSTLEVRSAVKAASSSMIEKSGKILKDMEIIENAMSVIKGSMVYMTSGTKSINEGSGALSEISDSIKASIEKIGTQIDKFQV